MTTLVVGANGATGKLLVEQLLNRGQAVKMIVRTTDSLPGSIKNNKNVSIIQASILDIEDDEMARHVKGCDAVASCLGHNISFKGIYGKPRRLVTDATRKLCRAIRANDPGAPVKFVLMNTSGNSNRDLSEKISFGQQCIIRLLRLLLPPHVDNEQAADFLRTEIGQDDKTIEWAAVRPDGLTDEREVTEYEIYPSPIRSALFDAGKVSRINVASFMAGLMTDQELCMQWKGQMPVIYSRVQGKAKAGERITV